MGGSSEAPVSTKGGRRRLNREWCARILPPHLLGNTTPQSPTSGGRVRVTTTGGQPPDRDSPAVAQRVGKVGPGTRGNASPTHASRHGTTA